MRAPERFPYSVNLSPIRVEEFINYHRHAIPLPADGQSLNLDVRAARLDEGGVVQIGLSTARLYSPSDAPPLNLVLVIDRSCSMAGARMLRVQRAISAFVEALRPQDRVALVGFGDRAEVLLKARAPLQLGPLNDAVQRLGTSGSTNLHAGLMLGYREALRHYAPERSNRVILLTDGIANRGETRPEAIARASSAFNRRGIDLTTIGLGRNFRESLLRSLAEAGRGQLHFVGDAADIKKTFMDELESLLAPAAKDIQVAVELGVDRSKVQVYGHQPRYEGSTMLMDLENMGRGATQVIMVEVPDSEVHGPINVVVSYRDAQTLKARELRSALNPAALTLDQRPLADPEVRKNYVIARVAWGIHQGVAPARRGALQEAIAALTDGVRFARARYAPKRDPDVDRVVGIADQYLQSLSRER